MRCSTRCVRSCSFRAMSVPRFHVATDLGPGDVGREIALPDAAAHHALRVLRLAAGDALTLSPARGGEFAATLVRADKRDARARLDAFSPVERESALAVTLVQGDRRERRDGLRRAQGGRARRGRACSRWSRARGARFPAGERGDKRLAHWRQIAVAACEQCGRNRVPPVHDVVTPRRVACGARAGSPGIVLDPEATHRPRAAARAGVARRRARRTRRRPHRRRDWRARRAPAFIAVRIGPRVLRTETASTGGARRHQCPVGRLPMSDRGPSRAIAPLGMPSRSWRRCATAIVRPPDARSRHRLRATSCSGRTASRSRGRSPSTRNARRSTSTAPRAR